MREAKYQLLRPLTARERSDLIDSIKEFGVQQAILKDEAGDILDGHNRDEIAAELGIDCPAEVRVGLSEEEKRRLILGLNEARRHLGQEEKRGMIAEKLKAAPERSNRQIAAEVGVDKNVVARARVKMEEAGDVVHCTTSTDTLGRQQPRKRESPKQERVAVIITGEKEKYLFLHHRELMERVGSGGLEIGMAFTIARLWDEAKSEVIEAQKDGWGRRAHRLTGIVQMFSDVVEAYDKHVGLPAQGKEKRNAR